MSHGCVRSCIFIVFGIFSEISFTAIHLIRDIFFVSEVTKMYQKYNLCNSFSFTSVSVVKTTPTPSIICWCSLWSTSQELEDSMSEHQAILHNLARTAVPLASKLKPADAERITNKVSAVTTRWKEITAEIRSRKPRYGKGFLVWFI